MSMGEPFAPEPLARLVETMAGFEPRWALCGGWAVDAWLGRETREHGDVDVCVFHGYQRTLFEHLTARGWGLVAHDPNVPGATTERWDGRWLDLPAHIHAMRGEDAVERWVLGEAVDGLKLEVILNERAGGEVVLQREPRVAVALEECIRECPPGLPAFAPEVLLFFKATAYFGLAEYAGRRGHDETDFLALLPSLPGARRAWLREAIGRVRPGHPWLEEAAFGVE